MPKSLLFQGGHDTLCDLLTPPRNPWAWLEPKGFGGSEFTNAPGATSTPLATRYCLCCELWHAVIRLAFVAAERVLASFPEGDTPRITHFPLFFGIMDFAQMPQMRSAGSNTFGERCPDPHRPS